MKEFKIGDRVQLSAKGLEWFRHTSNTGKSPYPWHGVVVGFTHSILGVIVRRDGLALSNRDSWHIEFWELEKSVVAHGILAATPEECLW